MKIKKIEPRNYWMNELFPASFNGLVKDFFDNDVSEVYPSKAFFKPSADITETDEQFNLEIALPGIKKEDLKIELNNGVLEVSGERKNKREESKDKYHLSEITYGKFMRKFHLPDNVNAEKIDASVDEGILHLSIPKNEDKKPRLIDVK